MGPGTHSVRYRQPKRKESTPVGWQRVTAGVRYVTNTAPDGTYTVAVSQQGRPLSQAQYGPQGKLLAQTAWSYDELGRRRTATDARNGATTYAYDLLDRVLSVTSPAPGDGAPAQTTGYCYDAFGRSTALTNADNTLTFTAYAPTGEKTNQWGSRTYPVQYTYDYAGRMKTMRTWQDTNNAATAAVTTWNYDSQRGWLLSKRDATNQGATYTYTPAGRLQTRAWARNVQTGYTNDVFGQVSRVVYSDGTAVTNGYDRLGRLVSAANSAGTVARVYSVNGEMLSETQNGIVVTNTFDALGRRRHVTALLDPASWDVAYDYAADSGHLESVTAGDDQARYSYIDHSPLTGQIELRHANAARMTTTKAYDNLGRLTQLESRETASGAVVVSFGSAYNAANQRTNTVTGPEGAQWRYGYDALGQVTNAWRYWRDGTRVPGQQFAYSFDQIGNRRTAWSGDPGAGLTAVPYQTDIVNQYTVRTNRQSVDIMGLAHASARVTLNGPGTTRKGEYYYRSYPTTNSTAASWQRMTITATLTNAGATTNIGWALMPRAQEVMSHDLDGNLTQDGLWTYTWDAENRLARMQSSQMSSNCGAPVMALDFAYDAGGRRTAKTVSCWTNGGWTVLSKLRFVYDGWNLVAELNATNNSVIRTYAWGTDASGSMQGAGGVGGLLWVTRTSDSTTHFTCYDGNHNVMALVNAATGETSAQYEYGPFHELLRATGPMARENVFLAATKYQDWETGFYYYGYRYYSPSTGRWLSRDPIGELGFETLRCRPARVIGSSGNRNAFSRNNPLSVLDPFGLYEYEWDDALSDTQKCQIQASITRVRNRAQEVAVQTAKMIHNMEKCKCPAYAAIVKDLKRLLTMLESMVSEIDDPEWHLEVDVRPLGGSEGLYWNSPVPWYDDELTVPPGWFDIGTPDSDKTIFHEITHGQGTTHDGKDNYDDAGTLELLMTDDLKDWKAFHVPKDAADDQCLGGVK